MGSEKPASEGALMLVWLRVLIVVVAVAITGYLAWPAVVQTKAVPHERRVSTPAYERKNPPVFQLVPPEERQDWILAIWEDFAKAEFWVLALAAGAWMLLPRALSRAQALRKSR